MRFLTLLSLSLALFTLVQPPAFGDPPTPGETATEIQSWIEGLQSDRFAVREWATQSLINAGGAIIEPLANGISNVDIETTERGLSILHTLAIAESETARQAEAALQRIASNPATTSAQRAEDVLRSIVSSRTVRAERILKNLGAEFDQALVTSVAYTYSPTVKTITIGDNWNGTVEDLAYVSWLKGYSKIAVKCQGKKFTDDHLLQIARATNLVGLVLSRANITDKGMSAIREMTALQDLRIYYCDVSNECLRFIGGDETALTSFSVFGGDITKPAFDELLAKYPQVVGRYGAGGFLGISGKADPNGRGCIVSSITPNKAANKAGILAGDIITEYNGQPVTEFMPTEQLMKNFAPVIPAPEGQEKKETRRALSELIGQNEPHDRVKITVLRRKQYIVKEVVLGEWP